MSKNLNDLSPEFIKNVAAFFCEEGSTWRNFLRMFGETLTSAGARTDRHSRAQTFTHTNTRSEDAHKYKHHI